MVECDKRCSGVGAQELSAAHTIAAGMESLERKRVLSYLESQASGNYLFVSSQAGELRFVCVPIVCAICILKTQEFVSGRKTKKRRRATNDFEGWDLDS